MQADRQRSLGLSGPHIDSRQRTAPWAIDQRGDQQASRSTSESMNKRKTGSRPRPLRNSRYGTREATGALELEKRSSRPTACPSPAARGLFEIRNSRSCRSDRAGRVSKTPPGDGPLQVDEQAQDPVRGDGPSPAARSPGSRSPKQAINEQGDQRAWRSTSRAINEQGDQRAGPSTSKAINEQGDQQAGRSRGTDNPLRTAVVRTVVRGTDNPPSVVRGTDNPPSVVRGTPAARSPGSRHRQSPFGAHFRGWQSVVRRQSAGSKGRSCRAQHRPLRGSRRRQPPSLRPLRRAHSQPLLGATAVAAATAPPQPRTPWRGARRRGWGRVRRHSLPARIDCRRARVRIFAWPRAHLGAALGGEVGVVADVGPQHHHPVRMCLCARGRARGRGPGSRPSR